MLSSIERLRVPSPSVLRSSLARTRLPGLMRRRGERVGAGDMLHASPDPEAAGSSPKIERIKRRPARADQTGNAQNFAAPEHQVRGSTGRLAWSARSGDSTSSTALARRMGHDVREKLVQVAADHVGNDRLEIGVMPNRPSVTAPAVS